MLKWLTRLWPKEGRTQKTRSNPIKASKLQWDHSSYDTGTWIFLKYLLQIAVHFCHITQ